MRQGGSQDLDLPTNPALNKPTNVQPPLTNFVLEPNGALSGSFLVGTTAEIIQLMVPEYKIVDDAKSPYGKVLELVASVALVQTARIEDCIKDDVEYQVLPCSPRPAVLADPRWQAVIRMKVDPNAKLDQIYFIVADRMRGERSSSTLPSDDTAFRSGWV